MSDNNNIHFRAEVIMEGRIMAEVIMEGKKEAYKKLIQDMSRAVEANEPDTINYRFYLNESETECIVWETYANSEAVLVHINGVASQTILPKVHSVSRISKLDVYGNPSKELQMVLTGTRTFNPFDGFSR
jgi:quinol monooxygenase YgiN